MSKIYEQHDKAFIKVKAYIIVHEGKRVATIAFKRPADGAGRLYAYVHWIGTEMLRGSASGGGYDKASAACASAVRACGKAPGTVTAPYDYAQAARAFCAALAKDGGYTWDRALRDAGFDVWQAV